jgi:Asp-tRNA(Asn)/Glu-tRNA(Gln) amidotransferase A subunit family amidase
MPDTAEAIFESGQPVFRAETAAVHALLFERNKDDYPPRIRNHIELGQATGAVEYVQALSACRQLRRALTDRLAGLDVILLPVAATTAPQGFSSTGSAIFCAPASFSGLPSIALPSDVSAYGLPLSVQLIAAPFAEARLLAAATLVERVLDFHAEPSLSA